jgi:hypothetical protein
MADTLTPLITDFLAWLEREPRAYADVMEAWRTSCPRLTVWEDATDRGFITREHQDGTTQIVVTAKGRAFLAESTAAAA